MAQEYRENVYGNENIESNPITIALPERQAKKWNTTLMK